MRQVFVLGIHTVSNLECTSVVHVVYALEGVDVVLLLHEVQGVDAVDVLLTLRVGLDGNNLYAYSVVEALLVEHYGELHIGTAGNIELSDVGSRYYLDAVPTLSYGLLPCSDLLSLGIVVGRESSETATELVVELGVLVVELKLHGVVRSDLCD